MSAEAPLRKTPDHKLDGDSGGADLGERASLAWSRAHRGTTRNGSGVFRRGAAGRDAGGGLALRLGVRGPAPVFAVRELRPLIEGNGVKSLGTLMRPATDLLSLLDSNVDGLAAHIARCSFASVRNNRRTL